MLELEDDLLPITTKERVKEVVRSVWKRHLATSIKHPHHYGTALGCTVLMFVMGHYDVAAIAGFWVYALVESITQGA